jgi:hypothetical protein
MALHGDTTTADVVQVEADDEHGAREAAARDVGGALARARLPHFRCRQLTSRLPRR